MDYQPKGVCSQQIHFDIIDNKVRNVSFKGGCHGNLPGNITSDRRDGRQRSDFPHRRNQMRFQINILSGSACTGIKTGSR